MPKLAYIEKRFRGNSLALIGSANAIIAEYEQQHFKLTLRQLYYQLVARDIIPNNLKSYKNLGALVNDARLAGYIDWDAIEDRTRNVRALSHWSSPADIMRAAWKGYNIDLWSIQPYRPEVWIEKDALIGVIERVCARNDVPYFSCRGYTSQSEMWSAAQRFVLRRKAGQKPVVIHLGDHDPSGIDMTRDMRDRLELFMGVGAHVERIALNWEQIEQYNPPANPAKLTDSRADAYIARFGRSSWELDALSPTVLDTLIQETIERFRNDGLWNVALERLERERGKLESVYHALQNNGDE